ncbi:MAG: OmpA family protein [Gammaproteobacteria bacterium]|nr:OmpA family protein [Gammaproteobacteria bacterium]
MLHWLKVFCVFLLVAVGFLFATPIRNTPPVSATSNSFSTLGPAFSVSLRGGLISVDGDTPASLHNDIVSLVKTMRSGIATLTASSIDVRGVATVHGDWPAALSKFRKHLPANVELVVDVFVIDESLSVDALCHKIFTAISDDQIQFQLSGSELKTSSYAALDRMINFARDCGNRAIHISGHSDTSGNVDSNRALSLQRAQAVADYLQQGGITLDRLQVEGRGSAEPIADNSTAHGRARNRRIEFALHARP